jgi:hypothetical protein
MVLSVAVSLPLIHAAANPGLVHNEHDAREKPRTRRIEAGAGCGAASAMPLIGRREWRPAAHVRYM